MKHSSCFTCFLRLNLKLNQYSKIASEIFNFELEQSIVVAFAHSLILLVSVRAATVLCPAHRSA